MARFILRYTGTAESLPAQRQQLLQALAAVPHHIVDDSQRMLLIEFSFDIAQLQSLLPAWKVIEERSLGLPREPGSAN